MQDNTGFSNSEFLRVGSLGSERTEIIRINGAVTRGTSLTTTATVFDHSAGSEVSRIIFNQVRIYGNSTNSSSGATLIATIDVQVDAPYTTYVNTSTEFAFYLAVGFNSNSSTEGDYSDGVARTTGYASNSVGSLINSALAAAKASKGSIITDEWLFSEINDCLRFMTGKLKRLSFLQIFDFALGQTVQGVNSFTLPSDIEDPNTIKSVLSVHLGGRDNLLYRDKREFDELVLSDARQTQVRTQASVGATTLDVDNSYDFDDSGSIDVFVSGTKYSLTYTGVTRSATAGVFTGIPASGTGSITVTTPVDSNVWQDEEEGEPIYFTVYDGLLKIYPLPDSVNDNRNVFLNYHSQRTVVNSAGDLIEGQRYDAVKHWLVAKLRAQNNATGEMNQNDGDWLLFREILSDMIRVEISGQKFKMKPKMNRISYGDNQLS